MSNSRRTTRDLFGQSLHILGKLVLDERSNLYIANTFQNHAHISGTTFTNELCEYETEQGISVIGNVIMHNDYVLSVNNFKVTNIVGPENIYVGSNLISQNKICSDVVCGNTISSNVIKSNILFTDIVSCNDTYSNIIWTNTLAGLSDEIHCMGNFVATNIHCKSLQIEEGGLKLGNSAIKTMNIANGTVTNEKIHTATITGDKIAPKTIHSNNLSNIIVAGGPVGNALIIPQISWDQTGRLTAVSQIAIVDTSPIGTLLDFAGCVAPPGYLMCDGSSLPTTGPYADLFAVIGYSYGGSGSNFNIPDFRGRFARYADNMGSGAAGRDTGPRDAYSAQSQSTAANGLMTSSEGAHWHYLREPQNAPPIAGNPISWNIGNTNNNSNFQLGNLTNSIGTNPNETNPIGTNNNKGYYVMSSIDGSHTHALVNPEGAETRPMNVRCYKIIKT